MKSLSQTLSPYTTTKVRFNFYFPKEGEFQHFPSNISIDQKVIARANLNTLKVVRSFTISKKETFNDILQNGTKEDVLEFLRTANLLKAEKGFYFHSMLYLLKDKVFFFKVVEILRKRLIFEN